MTTGADFMTGEAAAELTGLSVAEIDRAAATGQIPAHYTGWQLLVDPHSLVPPDPEALTVPELKAVLDERGVEYDSRALKADLIELVKQTE